MGVLYVVATPLGNLEDITLRALRVLREASLIAAEDTRRTRVLLRHYDINVPLTSYFEHNKVAKLDYILAQLRQKDVAIVSEAGTPGISDPGYELVRAAIAAGYRVVPIPGPSALITALSVAGLPNDQFTFVGFLPRRSSERRRRFLALVNEPRTIVFYEAPHRMVATLNDLRDTLGERRIAIARELTKIHEEIIRGEISDAILHFVERPPRGEFTVLVAPGVEESRAPLSEAEQGQRLNELLAEGLSPRRAAAVLAKETGTAVREIYQRRFRGKKG